MKLSHSISLLLHFLWFFFQTPKLNFFGFCKYIVLHLVGQPVVWLYAGEKTTNRNKSLVWLAGHLSCPATGMSKNARLQTLGGPPLVPNPALRVRLHNLLLPQIKFCSILWGKVHWSRNTHSIFPQVHRKHRVYVYFRVRIQPCFASNIKKKVPGGQSCPNHVKFGFWSLRHLADSAQVRRTAHGYSMRNWRKPIHNRERIPGQRAVRPRRRTTTRWM